MSDVIRLRRYAMMHALGIPLLMVLTESALARSAVLLFGIVMHIIYHVATERASRDVAAASTMDEAERLLEQRRAQRQLDSAPEAHE